MNINSGNLNNYLNHIEKGYELPSYLDIHQKPKEKKQESSPVKCELDLIQNDPERKLISRVRHTPEQKTFWSKVKAFFASIGAFFLKLICIKSSNQSVSILGKKPVISKFNVQNEFNKAKESANANNWRKFINLIRFENQKINKAVVRFEILRLMHSHPEKNADLEKCLELLGPATKIAIAPLQNKNNNCYIDSLLQVLFASKSFIKLVDDAVVDPNHFLPETREAAQKNLAETTKIYNEAVKTKQTQAEIDLANENKKTALKENHKISHAPIVRALKEYSLGLQAGLEANDINALRDQFSASVEPLLQMRGQNIGDQNDSSELLDIILSALEVVNHFSLKLQESQKYPGANNFTINPQVNPIGAIPPQEIPAPKRLTIDEDEEASAQVIQQQLNELTNQMAIHYQINREILKINIVSQLNGILNKKVIPVKLQEVIDFNFKPREGGGDPHNDILAHYGINGVKFEQAKAGLKRELRSDLVNDLQRIIDRYFDNPDRVVIQAKSAFEHYGIDLKRLKELNEKNLQSILDKAGKFVKETTLIGQAPSFLTLVIKREKMTSFGTRQINPTKIEIPQNGIINITIEGQPVAYRVVGVVGKEGGVNGGHYLANTNIDNQWYHVNDIGGSRPVKRKSGNEDLTTNSRIYMLERIE